MNSVNHRSRVGCRAAVISGEPAQFTAERENTRIEIAVSATANRATTARLSHASAVTLLHAPDVVQPLAARVDEPVAHQRERVGERQDTFAIAVSAARHRADREQRAREEERQDRDRRDRADVLLLLARSGWRASRRRRT